MPDNLKEPFSMKPETIRLSVFLADCLSVGCLKGFKHFEVYLRGREELLLRVYIDSNNKTNSNLESNRLNYNSLSLAKSQSNALFSPKTRRTLSNGFDMDIILPPSSPLDKDLEKDETNHAFLIAGYARYKCPYVWLRSNHKRLIQLQDDQKLETDNPLKLDTIAAWKARDIKLWDIIAEVITLCLDKAPENPFEIDHSYYDTLPIEEMAVSTGAMVDFLQKVYLNDTPYASNVFEDIKQLQQRHFIAFEEMNEALNSNSLEKSNPSSNVSVNNTKKFD
ncbi:15070_t:CDS:2 [Funneliformis mosseae]|uniref:15070_t:CDS:1 n=1 Tax=Funneliformis mosseae TaxID=27381 RepID=A0A9N8ZYM1_FUNMO|nr:15070_t:CDS:2 [Funneliformis mosseae]